jgi:hypothetical protein
MDTVATTTDSFWFLGTRMAVKATATDTGGLFGLIDQSYLPPGFAAPPPAVDLPRRPGAVLCGAGATGHGPGDGPGWAPRRGQAPRGRGALPR